MTEFEVALPGPLDVAASVDRFRRWGDDLIDRWDGRTLLRAARDQAGRVLPLAAEPVGNLEEPRFRVRVASDRDAPAAEAAVRGMFHQAPARELGRLMASDPVVAELEGRFGGVRPVLERDPLTALVRSISAQQVNLRWAAETRRRLVMAYGHRHQLGDHEVWSLSAERLADADVPAIRALQFTTRKAEYIVGVARRIAEAPHTFAALAGLPDEEVITFLTAMPGIGRWSAEWYLARTLGRPVVAAGDLGVRKAVGRWYCGGAMPSEADARRATAHWGAAAGVAQQLLLESLYVPQPSGSPTLESSTDSPFGEGRLDG